MLRASPEIGDINAKADFQITRLAQNSYWRKIVDYHMSFVNRSKNPATIILAGIRFVNRRNRLREPSVHIDAREVERQRRPQPSSVEVQVLTINAASVIFPKLTRHKNAEL